MAGRSDKLRRHKLFMFDSVHHLLSRVRYDVPAGTNTFRRIEVFLEGWRSIQGQFVPGTVTRKQDGIEVFRFTVTEAAFGPKHADGIF